MVLLNKSERGFFAYSRNAGNIVRAVAHKSLDFQHFARRNSIHLVDFIGRVEYVLLVRGKTNGYFIVYQLKAVAVARHNNAVCVLLFRGAGKRSDNVVRLVSLTFYNCNSECAQYILDNRHLRRKFIRHCVASSLVFGVYFVTECRRFQVKSGGDTVGVFFFQKFKVYVHKTRQSVCRNAFRTCKHSYSVKCAVHYAVSVYQQ